MRHQAIGKKGEGKEWAKALRILGIVELSIFGFIWMGIGLYFFAGMCVAQGKLNARMATIARGEAATETLYVRRMSRDEGQSHTSVTLGRGGKELARRSTQDVTGLAEGSAVEAYRFGEEFVIPRWDRGPGWVRWLMLGMALLPLGVLGVIVAGMNRRRQREEETRPAIALPEAFTRSSLTFDAMPTGAELACLLGEVECTQAKGVEKNGVLRVGPQRIPVKRCIAWLMFILALATYGVYWKHQQREEPAMSKFDVLDYVGLGFGWVIVLPVFGAILVALDVSVAQKGDCFRVDRVRRTLELRRIGRIVHGEEIRGFVMLNRWVKLEGEWASVRQTSVLLGADGGRMELVPVICEAGDSVEYIWPKHKEWAERLAEIFQVPVRWVEVPRTESRALRDSAGE